MLYLNSKCVFTTTSCMPWAFKCVITTTSCMPWTLKCVITTTVRPTTAQNIQSAIGEGDKLLACGLLSSVDVRTFNFLCCVVASSYCLDLSVSNPLRLIVGFKCMTLG